MLWLLLATDHWLLTPVSLALRVELRFAQIELAFEIAKHLIADAPIISQPYGNLALYPQQLARHGNVLAMQHRTRLFLLGL